uniref:Interferon-induced protein 44-like n=1 Tax=Sphaeramia orbicularis TaxID=375764 RepID=A0A673AJR9_9TELE
MFSIDYIQNTHIYVECVCVYVQYVPNFTAMGGKNSKPEVKPPSLLLDKEWRPVPWNAKAEYLQSVRCFEPFQPHNDERNEDQHIRILLHGPVGHGKSSFINTVNSVLRDRMTGRALAVASGTSFTKKYTTYKITKGARGTFYPFVFNDTMGLEKDHGVREEDIKLAMMGHVKDGYRFNPHSTLSTDDPYYNTNPSLSDKAHVLVCVVSANKVHLLDDGVKKKMTNVMREAGDMGIPQMVILTKIDEACPEVDADLRNVYKSKFVKEQMELLSESLGIPLNCIFPVKNYHSEITPNDDLEMLILMALRQMINYGEDFVDNL